MLFLAGLSACGFQLQGAFTTPTAMQKTYIDAVDGYSQFLRSLKTELGSTDIELTDSRADATATLFVSFDETAQRVLSVSARNVPTEYEVYYTVTYRLES